MPVSAGKLPPDVVNSNETASSYPQVFETWDSSESEGGDTDAVAMAMSKDSADVINNNTFNVEEVTETWDSWGSTESVPEDAGAVAVTMDKELADVVDSKTPDNKEVDDSWDSANEADTMNTNSREK